MALKPLLKTKVDELFLLWLSESETQNLLRSSLTQVLRGEPVTRPASQLSALVKTGNGSLGRQQAPKSPRIRPSSPPHLPTNVPSPRNRVRHSLNVCTVWLSGCLSVGLSVCVSVSQSVGRSVCLSLNGSSAIILVFFCVSFCDIRRDCKVWVICMFMAPPLAEWCWRHFVLGCPFRVYVRA